MRQSVLFWLALGVLACNTATLEQASTPDGGIELLRDAGGRVDDDRAAALPDGDLSEDAAPHVDVESPPAAPVRIVVVPGDNGAALLGAVRGATQSVYVSMYLLTWDTFEKALLERHRAGREVKVVLNQKFPGEVSGNPNQEAYDLLTQGGISVAWAPAVYPFTHAKYVLIDEREAWVMTMNATNTSPFQNREFLAVLSRREDLQELRGIFDADFGNLAYTRQGNLVVSPINARARLEALVEGATSRIDMEAESLSDDGIVEALVRAKGRGVAVHIAVATGTHTPAEADAHAVLKGAGIRVVEVARPYIHAKAIAVDRARAYVGSQNFTFTSIQRNREVGVITDVPAEVKKVTDTIDADYARGTAL